MQSGLPKTGEAVCSECDGAGTDNGHTCEACAGTGKVLVTHGDA